MSEDYAIYSCYNDLFAFYLRSNLEKAILLGKALDSEEEQKSIPVYLQKMFLLHSGTAHLLQGNYLKAKEYLRECLKRDPSQEVKAAALNNLALAYYWQKISMMDSQDRIGKFPRDSDEIIEKEFKTVISLLMEAIRCFEGVDDKADTHDKLFFAKLLDKDRKGLASLKDLEGMAELSNSLSAYPILTIVDLLLNVDKTSRNVANVWLMYLLKNDQNIQARHFARALTMLGRQTAGEKQLISSEGLFRKALSVVAEEFCYENVEAHVEYSKMLEQIPNRTTDVDLEIERANEVISYLPYWSPKLMHTVLPDFEFN